MEQENRVRMERIAADPQSGLSAEQVKRRFAQGENNYKVESSTLSVPEIVRSNVCTYFNLVFAVDVGSALGSFQINVSHLRVVAHGFPEHVALIMTHHSLVHGEPS